MVASFPLTLFQIGEAALSAVIYSFHYTREHHVFVAIQRAG